MDSKPVRGTKESVQWCRNAVDQCWKMKRPRIRKEEREAAKAGYNHARTAYDRVLAELKLE